MADRRSFLGAVSGAAVSVVLAKAAEAQTAPDKPSPGATSSPPAGPLSPQPSPSPKPPSAAARAQAEAMRAFDPGLSDAQLETIARGIDGGSAAGQKLNKRGRVLKNSDEPVTRFRVDAAVRS